MRGVKTKANILKIYERNEKDTGGKDANQWRYQALAGG